MKTDGDPSEALIDHLRSLWEQESEARELPPVFLEETDRATQATVGWLQSAWEVEALVAESDLPLAAEPKLRPRRLPKLRVGPSPMAALATAAAAATLLLLVPRGVPEDPRPPIPVTASTGLTAPVIFEPSRVTSREDGIEIITGSVRVVLVQPTR